MRLILLALALPLTGCGAHYSIVLRNATTEPLEAAILHADDDPLPAARATLAPGGTFSCRVSRSSHSRRLLRVHIPEYAPHATQHRTIAHGERLHLRAEHTDHGLTLLDDRPPWQGPAYASDQ